MAGNCLKTLGVRFAKSTSLKGKIKKKCNLMLAMSPHCNSQVHEMETFLAYFALTKKSVQKYGRSLMSDPAVN